MIANICVTRIFETYDLQELTAYLMSFSNLEAVRECLYSRFLGYAVYHNVEEWNKSVRLCEALAIVGWGGLEALEAVRGSYFNGNPNTFYVNRYGQTRFLDAVWSKRKDRFMIDPAMLFFHESQDAPQVRSGESDRAEQTIQEGRLNGQRNWIAKNPVCLTRGIANCYANSKPVIESVERELKPTLDQRMRPELYGDAINRIIINCSYSFYDDYHCKTNYVIADESLKLRQKDFYPTLLEMYSEEEIEANGYYLRNRFAYGPFRRDTGTVRVDVVFEKEYSELPWQKQKQVLCEYLLCAVRQVANRLSKKVDYNYGLMITDFYDILQEWCNKGLR